VDRERTGPRVRLRGRFCEQVRQITPRASLLDCFSCLLAGRKQTRTHSLNVRHALKATRSHREAFLRSLVCPLSQLCATAGSRHWPLCPGVLSRRLEPPAHLLEGTASPIATWLNKERSTAGTHPENAASLCSESGSVPLVRV
jgi:hypothetical protein